MPPAPSYNASVEMRAKSSAKHKYTNDSLAWVSPPFELNCWQRKREKSLPLLVPSVPERFQCQRGAVRRAVARVDVVFLSVVAGKGIANAAIAPTKPPKMANSTFWFVYESTTPAMLIVWREPPAKASFVATSDRRKLGT